MGEVKIFYFLSESLLEKLSNINYFTSKLILTKLISIKLILCRINSIKIEPNTHSTMCKETGIILLSTYKEFGWFIHNIDA